MLEQIGEGGVGREFRAEHLGTGRMVALELRSAESLENPNVRARFLAEAKVTTSIAHEHIVEMLDAGISSSGQPFVAMELLAGEPLASLIRANGRISWAQTRDIISQVAAGLAHAHKHGVVHRYIKPENIMICPGEGNTDTCKIIDFGLAHLKQHADLVEWESISGQPIGTAPTMSHEQVEGNDVSPSSDIYALGCVLYRLLAGHYPYPAQTIIEFATAHLFAQPQPLPVTELDTLAKLQVDTIARRCLAKDPRRRTATMAALMTALWAMGGCPASLDRSRTSTLPELPTFDGRHETLEGHEDSAISSVLASAGCVAHRSLGPISRADLQRSN